MADDSGSRVATPTENRLANLCRNTFSKMWSYPSPFKNQGMADAGVGKEIVDVLVAFGNHILLFSDKEITYREELESGLAWSRWYNKAVRDSAKQLKGAERWIRTFPDQVYLDSMCRSKIDLQLCDELGFKFHRIVVANGAQKACLQNFGGGSGSLHLTSKHFSEGNYRPFTLHQPFPGEFYHVLDDTSLGIILDYLDTPSDLIAYLDSKETLFLSGCDVQSAGEEEILGEYLQTIVDDRHSFEVESGKSVTFEEGVWARFKSSHLLKSKTQADRVSFVWDEIVEKSVQSYLDGTAILHSGNKDRFPDFYKTLASPTRLERRILGFKLHELQFDREGPKKASIVLLEKTGKHLWVLLVLAREKLSESDRIRYKEIRLDLLRKYVTVAMYLHPSANLVSGLAISGIEDGVSSEDVIEMRKLDWSEALEDFAKAWHDQGFFKSTKHSNIDWREYPTEEYTSDRVSFHYQWSKY